MYKGVVKPINDIAKWVLRRFATSYDIFATSQIRRRRRRIALSHRKKKKKYKSAFKSFINAYNNGMNTLNVYGSTGNKQTNKRTLAFYKRIDVISIYTILYIGTCDMGIQNVIQYSIAFF